MPDKNTSDDVLEHAGQEFLERWGFLLIDKTQAANLSPKEAASLMQKWAGEEAATGGSETKDRSGYIYLAKMYAGDGYVYKIGRSKNPKDRVQVFNVEMPVDVEIINHFPVEDAPETESKLHDYFDPWHEEGEWFDPPANHIVMLKHATGFSEEGFEFPEEKELLDSYYRELQSLPLEERMKRHPDAKEKQENRQKRTEKERIQALAEKDWSRLETEMPLPLNELENLVAHVRRRTRLCDWNGCQTSIPLPRAADVNEVAQGLKQEPEAVYAGSNMAEVTTDQRGNVLSVTRKLYGSGRGCDTSLRFTREYLKFHDGSIEDWEGFRSWLMEFGGGCDCEVVSNVWRSCWKHRASGAV